MLSFRERNTQCDSESIESNDMIDLLLKVLKSLEDVGQKESFLRFMGLLASATFPLHNICYLLFLDIVESDVKPHPLCFRLSLHVIYV
jgi:hypothetical protein